MIRLPALFERILSRNPSLASQVRLSLDIFEPWLEQSGMPFFPGFTDHSPRHINDVLDTAASLISDASRKLLNPEDIAVLSLAILLHDCGMHLTQDGFRALICSSNDRIKIPQLDPQSWPALWRNFVGEVNRFGEEKLLSIFGSPEPFHTDLIDLEDLSEKTCLIVGEFIRRHHARLAHEIAVAGVPSSAAASLHLMGIDADLKDISGLVARSHGLAIRASFSYLADRYDTLPSWGSRCAEFDRISMTGKNSRRPLHTYRSTHASRQRGRSCCRC
jgi:molecular chaperone HtpG